MMTMAVSTVPSKANETVENRESVLSVRNLVVEYDTPVGQVKAVDGVSFDLYKGERLGLVGESGSGKTTMAMAIMRLTKPPARVVGGQVIMGGRDLLSFSKSDMDMTRLSEIALVPQGAMNSLNPVMRVGKQIADGIAYHSQQHSVELNSRKKVKAKITELLSGVGLAPNVAEMYPHELSGGMKQRVALAIATVLSPSVIVADEPTSALDVVVQRQIMLTLEKLQSELGASVILVGHDMGLMAQFANRIGVMYAGELVELAPVEEVFESPRHPYTKLLISSLPSLKEKRELSGIPGLPPTLINPPTGCHFHPRCPSVMERCSIDAPVLDETTPGCFVACHLYPEGVYSR